MNFPWITNNQRVIQNQMTSTDFSIGSISKIANLWNLLPFVFPLPLPHQANGMAWSIVESECWKHPVLFISSLPKDVEAQSVHP